LTDTLKSYNAFAAKHEFRSFLFLKKISKFVLFVILEVAVTIKKF